MGSEYDDVTFFNEYAKMARSRNGLEAAGEWHQLKPLFPSLSGKSVLDLGCGYGWHCRFCEENGAARVLGIDCSRKMLEEAEKHPSGKITYRLCDICGYEYPENEWDVVVSNLALHYVEDLDIIFRLVYRTLKKGGVFIFNIEHPVFTSGLNEDWLRRDGEIMCWPVDNYFYPGERQTNFLGCQVKKYHHTLSQILMGVINAGFTLQCVDEARPDEKMMELPGMKDELRRPMMLLVRAVKK